ncbi:late embryogenesis abundant protein 7 [Citrus clementina]|uniref:late embryogenesis abundant protein 7 n=1 Tax=Citrus clementina TaxID=85681 RepID=UPI000CED4604|nr:late embryogenesis abundant protein 7 [Citrus x clementina]
MASQQAGQEIPQTNAQTACQPQPVPDAVIQEALDNLASISQSAQNDNTYKTQATNLLQQTGEQVKNMAQGAGEQVKNMAQGAAHAVKNTLGMNADNTDTTLPIDHSTPAGTGTTATHPSSLNAEHPSNPTNNINITTTNPRI